MFAQGSRLATLHEPDSHATATKSSKYRFQVLAQTLAQGYTYTQVWVTLGAPYNFILQTLSIFFQYFIYCFKYFILWYTCGDIYIDNVNGQSKMISKRGSEEGSRRKREERRWRWQEARDKWRLKEFLGNKRCDMLENPRGHQAGGTGKCKMGWIIMMNMYREIYLSLVQIMWHRCPS